MMLDLDTIGYFSFMENEEKKMKEYTYYIYSPLGRVSCERMTGDQAQELAAKGYHLFASEYELDSFLNGDLDCYED